MSRDGAAGVPSALPDARDIDDPARLLEEAREQREKMAAELRTAALSIEIEPAPTFRP